MVVLFLLVGCQEQSGVWCNIGPQVDDGGEVLPELGRTGDQLMAEFVPETVELQWDIPGPLPVLVPLSDPIFGWANTARCQLDWYQIGVGVRAEESQDLSTLMITFRPDGSVFARSLYLPLIDPGILAWSEQQTGVSPTLMDLILSEDRVKLQLYDAVGEGVLENVDYPDSFHGTSIW